MTSPNSSLSSRPKSRDPYAAAYREDTEYGSLLSQGRQRTAELNSISSRRARRAHFRGGGAHCLDDVLIAGAATKVGREDVEKVFVADVGVLLQRVGGQHQEAGSAEAALQSVMGNECALQRMQRVAYGQPLDGADLFALRLHREHQAGAQDRVVEDDGASPANAVLAAD